jgi:hypothetical protein
MRNLGRWLEELDQNLRYGARILGKNPGFTLVAALILALGSFGKVLAGALYEIQSNDYPVMIEVTALLLAVSCFAIALPGTGRGSETTSEPRPPGSGLRELSQVGTSQF